MPYHPDSTTRALFIEQHIHTSTDLSKVICSICRQRCTGQHEIVQIAGHPACQCVFGRTCLLQWLRSGSAASNTCPSCKAVLFNPTAEEREDSSDPDSDSDSDDEDGLPVFHRGRARARPTQADRSRRETAPSPSPSRSSSSSGNEELHTAPTHSYNLRSRRFSPSPSSASSCTLSAGSTASTSTAIDTLVDDLWAGTWDLVTDSWSLTPAGAPKSCSTSRAQLIMLILDVYPFDGKVEGGVLGAGRAVIEHLVIRARKMVHKHRKNGRFKMGSELRTEREDIRLAVRYGV